MDVLEVHNLTVEIVRAGGRFPVVRGVSFTVRPGETVCIVGESGSGKTVTALSLLGLAPSPPFHVSNGSIRLEGRDLLRLDEAGRRALRGDRIAMIFQDPMTSLNPVLTIGEQITECLAAHQKRAHPRLGAREMRTRAAELLALVGIPSPAERLDSFAHQMSGGMRQRVLIAMALANHPRLIVADEPTTALDVTVQAQVMEVMREACEKTGAALLLITHDMGLVAESADRVLVFYAGSIVESGSVREVFRQPRHPYTRALLASIPRFDDPEDKELNTIEGDPPDPARMPGGCAFHPRCWLMQGRSVCASREPALVKIAPGHDSACHFAEEMTEQLFALPAPA